MEPELLLLKRSFERLDRQYRSADEKLSEFRERLRETKLELAQKDRQLETAKKLLAAAGQERFEQQVAAEQSRDLTRRLGAKLSLQGPELPELTAKLGRSKRKVVELSAQLHEAQTRLLLSEEAGRQQSAELAVLKKALGLRTELALPGLAGFDGQAQLLHSLARSQEESANLAAQLAEGSRRASSLEDQVAYLQGEVERAVGARVAAEEGAGAARRDTGEALGRAAALKLDIDDLQAQLRRTSAHLDEVALGRRAAEERGDAAAGRARQLAEQLAAAERAGRAQVESLRADITSLVEQSEGASEAMRALHGAREAALEGQLAAAHKHAAEMEARLSQSSREHGVEVLRLQSRLGALEAALEGCRLREAALEKDGAAAKEEAGRLARLGNELSSSLAVARAEADGYCERAEEAAAHTDTERRLRMQVQSQLEGSSQRGAVREEQLAAEAARLRGEGAALALANERLSGEVKQAREDLSGAAARQSASERHIEELHAAVTSLTRSKSKLQSTMLEQLSLFKSKLQQVEADNAALRGALLTAAASPESVAAAAAFGGNHSPSFGVRDHIHHHGYRGSPAGGAASSAAGMSPSGGSTSYSPAGAGYGSPLAAYHSGTAGDVRGRRALYGE